MRSTPAPRQSVAPNQLRCCFAACYTRRQLHGLQGGLCTLRQPGLPAACCTLPRPREPSFVTSEPLLLTDRLSRGSGIQQGVHRSLHKAGRHTEVETTRELEDRV